MMKLRTYNLLFNFTVELYKPFHANSTVKRSDQSSMASKKAAHIVKPLLETCSPNGEKWTQTYCKITYTVYCNVILHRKQKKANYLKYIYIERDLVILIATTKDI